MVLRLLLFVSAVLDLQDMNEYVPSSYETSSDVDICGFGRHSPGTAERG